MPGQNLIIKVLGAFIALAFIMALAAGVRAFGGGNLAHARQIATRLQEAATANPNPTQVGGPSLSAGTSVAAASPAVSTAPAASHTAPGNSVTAPTGTQATNAAPGTTARAATTTPAPRSTTAAPAVVASPPPVMSSAAPRRQPTAAEVAQAISAVHSAVPFFTPTPAQIASAGDQACTALDLGKTFSQVKSAALNLVGAGSYSWMIPSSVPDIAVRTLVALYCPGNASKLA